MNEPRFVVSDVLWQRLAPRLRGKTGDAGATAKECAIDAPLFRAQWRRLFLVAVFWRVRTGSPWRDLPPAFGHWNSPSAVGTGWGFRASFQGYERRQRPRIRTH